MAMLQILLDLQQPHLWPLQLVIAHCDHQMRADSAANAEFVQQHARQLGLVYLERTADQRLGSEVS
jgi:tRNA(Ile)-lysidine synthase TilS/MesJ